MYMFKHSSEPSVIHTVYNQTKTKNVREPCLENVCKSNPRMSDFV